MGHVFPDDPDSTGLRHALEHSDYSNDFKKCVFYQDGNKPLELWLEMSDESIAWSAEKTKDLTEQLCIQMARQNQDFRAQISFLEDGASLPIVKDADGHRKQVPRASALRV